jgi:hypothetical protein
MPKDRISYQGNRFKKFKGYNKEFTYMRFPGYILIALVFFICMMLVLPAYADTSTGSTDSTTSTTHERTWLTPAGRIWQQKHRVIFSADDTVAEGDRAKQGGDYSEALGNYNMAIDQIQNSGQLSAPEKNKKLAEIYRHKAELYRVRQAWGDDAEAARADEKAQSYIDKGTYSGPCPVYLTYYLTPLAGTVQQVKDFRDGSIMQSYTGSRFMEGFNTWYRSISPSTAGYIDEHPLVKSALRFDLAPLLGIVLIAQGIFSLLSFNPEVATTGALITGGALYGFIYIFPYSSLGMLIARYRGWRIPKTGSMKPMVSLWALIIAALATGMIFSLDFLTVVSSGLLVLCTMILSAGVTSLVFCGYVNTSRSDDKNQVFSRDRARMPEGIAE